MFKNLLKLNALAFLAILATFASCGEEDFGTADVDNYVIESTFEIQKDLMVGRPGCYELVFPISLQFPDSTVAEVDSYENLKETVRNWRQDNPGIDGRPTLVFPIDVLNEDGELITINNREELKELRKECKENFRHGPRDHHRHGRFRACFDLVFPISILLPDGTSVAVDDYRELKDALKRWRHHPHAVTDHPVIEFPIEIEFDDGTTQVINSPAELKQAKRACRD